MTRPVLAALRPTLPKLLFAAALFILSYVAQSVLWNARVADYWAYGFPFHFQELWGPCPPGEVCRAFNWLAFLADVLIWYLVAAGIGRILTPSRSAPAE